MEELSQKFSEYWVYLDEIRKKILTLVIFFIIFFVIGFFLTNPILRFVIKFLGIKNVTIATTSPFQFIDLAMNIGVVVAVVFTLPVAIFLIFDFLRGGLKPREKNFFIGLLPIGLLLFVIGFAYGFAIMYYALGLIAAVNIGLGISNLWDISRFLYQITITSVFLGIIFQFPIVLAFLVKTGVVDRNFLINKRRHAFIIIFVIVSLLPPTDGLSLIIMSLPLLLIYEGTIMICRFLN
jgi:sec-independent protein translocase protein TatC